MLLLSTISSPVNDAGSVPEADDGDDLPAALSAFGASSGMAIQRGGAIVCPPSYSRCMGQPAATIDLPPLRATSTSRGSCTRSTWEERLPSPPSEPSSSLPQLLAAGGGESSERVRL